MWAHIEEHGQCDSKCSGLIRVFEDGQVFGDEYLYAMKFVKHDENTIEFVGVTKPAPTPSQGKAILAAVRAKNWRVLKDRKTGANPGVREVFNSR